MTRDQALLFLDRMIDHPGEMQVWEALNLLRAAKDKHRGWLSKRPGVIQPAFSFEETWRYLFKSFIGSNLSNETVLPPDLAGMMIVEFTDAYSNYSA